MIGMKQLLAVTVATLGISATANESEAGVYQHIDGLAFQVQNRSTDLYNEFRVHYSHTPYYRVLMANTARMASLAHHIHEVAHHQGSVYHLNRDLQELDRLFHRVEAILLRLEHDARFLRIGHIHGRTGHVARKMRLMENDLHHLRADIQQLLVPPRPICPLDGGFGNYNNFNPYGLRNGYTIGNGRVQVRIR